MCLLHLRPARRQDTKTIAAVAHFGGSRRQSVRTLRGSYQSYGRSIGHVISDETRWQELTRCGNSFALAVAAAVEKRSVDPVADTLDVPGITENVLARHARQSMARQDLGLA